MPPENAAKELKLYRLAGRTDETFLANELKRICFLLDSAKVVVKNSAFFSKKKCIFIFSENNLKDFNSFRLY